MTTPEDRLAADLMRAFDELDAGIRRERQAAVAPHPAYQGLPALHMATLGLRDAEWWLRIDGPSGQVGDVLTLDVKPVYEMADSDGPGRYLIAPADGPTAVPPIADAIVALGEAGFVIDPCAAADPKTWAGWTQITYQHWTAPCQPADPAPDDSPRR